MTLVLSAAPPRKQSFTQKLSQGVGRGLEVGQQLIQQHQEKQRDQQENEAVKNLIGKDISGIRDPKIRQEFVNMALQGQNQSEKFKSELLNNKKIIDQLEQDRNLEKGSLSAYENDPKMAEQISRPAKQPTRRLSEIPIDPEQKSNIAKARSIPGFDEMDELEQYKTLVDNGVSPELAEKESKLRGSQLERKHKEFDNSYKAQEDFINDTTKSYEAFETQTKPRLMQMQNIPDEDVIGPTAAVFLEHLGIPLGALDDPSSELYNKLSQDLLKGLPETYGSRILKVEVDNFLKTIPTLMNSADGRRMIASNMLKLGEMKEVYYNEMRKMQKDAIDNRKNLPKDFQQRVFDQVKPQIDRINNEFVKLSEIKHVPKGTIPFFSPTGEINFVPKEHAQWAQEHEGRRIW